MSMPSVSRSGRALARTMDSIPPARFFDRDALGVMNNNQRVTTQYNPKAEFTNYFYKKDARYFNDLNENFVVFYVA